MIHPLGSTHHTCVKLRSQPPRQPLSSLNACGMLTYGKISAKSNASEEGYLLPIGCIFVDRSTLEVALAVFHVQSDPFRCLKVVEVFELNLGVGSLRLMSEYEHTAVYGSA